MSRLSLASSTAARRTSQAISWTSPTMRPWAGFGAAWSSPQTTPGPMVCSPMLPPLPSLPGQGHGSRRSQRRSLEGLPKASRAEPATHQRGRLARLCRRARPRGVPVSRPAVSAPAVARRTTVAGTSARIGALTRRETGSARVARISASTRCVSVRNARGFRSRFVPLPRWWTTSMVWARWVPAAMTGPTCVPWPSVVTTGERCAIRSVALMTERDAPLGHDPP